MGVESPSAYSHTGKASSAPAYNDEGPESPDRLRFVAPLKPVLGLDVNKLPMLLTEEFYHHRLLPWCDPGLRPEAQSLEPGLPPWSLSLESYHVTFHPYAWIFLERQYTKQIAYFHDVQRWIRQRQRAGAMPEELEKLEKERQEAHDVAWTIFASVYGLHYLRQRYLEPYRKRALSWDVSKILSVTLEFEVSGHRRGDVPYFSCIEEYSLWPLPLRPPSDTQWPPISRKSSLNMAHRSAADADQPSTTRVRPSASSPATTSSPPSPPAPPSRPSAPKPLIHLASLSNTARWDYVVRRFDKNWPKYFKAMPFDEFEGRYKELTKESGEDASPGFLDEQDERVDQAYCEWEASVERRAPEKYRGAALAWTAGWDAMKRLFGAGGPHLE